MHDHGGDDYGDEDMPMGDGGQNPGAGGDAVSMLQNFASNPMFRQVAERLRNDPAFYQEFLQRMQTDDPQMFQAINANPMAFMNILLGGNPNIGGAMGGGMP